MSRFLSLFVVVAAMAAAAVNAGLCVDHTVSLYRAPYRLRSTERTRVEKGSK
jgi:hypothetical protein